VKIWLRLLLIGLAAIIGISGLSFWMVARSWRREFNDELRRLEQNGSPICASQLAPPPVPDENNAALLIAEAGLLLKGSEEDEEPDWDSLSKEEGLDLESLRAFVAKRKTALEKLVGALNRPYCRFPLDYSKGLLAEVPHVSTLMSFARALNARTLLSLRAGDHAASLRDLRLTLRLSGCLAGEPLLVSQLVRYVIFDRAFEILKMDLLALSPEEWKALAQAFRAATFGGEFARSFEMERASAIDLCRTYYFEGKQGEGAAKIPVGGWVLPLFAAKAGTYHLRVMERAIILARQPYPKARGGELALKRELESDPRWYELLTRLLLPAILRAHGSEARAEAQQEMAAAFCLIKADGRIPESLELMDPRTGFPFLYARIDGGFELRSPGPGQKTNDETDRIVLKTRGK